jgi:hypothetical protein
VAISCTQAEKIVVDKVTYSWSTSALINVQGLVTNSCDSWAKVWPKAIIRDNDGKVVKEKDLSLPNQMGPSFLWLAPDQTEFVEIPHLLVPKDDEFGAVDLWVSYEFTGPPYGYGQVD